MSPAQWQRQVEPDPHGRRAASAERGRIERAAVALADDGLALDRELPLGRALAFWGGPRLGEALTAFDLDRLADVPGALALDRAGQARAIGAGDGERCADLWLLDEPLNGLDRDGVARLDAVIANHRESGGAVLAASHVPLAGAWREVAL
jgi:heme exporter protein A